MPSGAPQVAPRPAGVLVVLPQREVGVEQHRMHDPQPRHGVAHVRPRRRSPRKPGECTDTTASPRSRVALVPRLQVGQRAQRVAAGRSPRTRPAPAARAAPSISSGSRVDPRRAPAGTAARTIVSTGGRVTAPSISKRRSATSCERRRLAGSSGAQPIEPTISSWISRLSSTAYSIGSSFVTGSMKPLTIIAAASSSVKPREPM